MNLFWVSIFYTIKEEKFIMKLKKIASLMLAGVMAVSMLAGCSGNTNPNPNPEPDEGNTVTGYSSKLQSELSAVSKSKLQLSDSSELNSALQYAVGYIGNDSVSAGFIYNMVNSGTVNYLPYNIGYTSAVDMVNELRDKLDVDLTWHGDVASSIGMLNPTTDADAKKDDVHQVVVFAVDDGVELDNVMDKIAAQINASIENLADDYKLSTGSTNTNVNYHYTGSVAVCNRNFETGHGVGLNFIAVELVRHIG